MENPTHAHIHTHTHTESYVSCITWYESHALTCPKISRWAPPVTQSTGRQRETWSRVVPGDVVKTWGAADFSHVAFKSCSRSKSRPDPVTDSGPNLYIDNVCYSYVYIFMCVYSFSFSLLGYSTHLINHHYLIIYYILICICFICFDLSTVRVRLFIYLFYFISISLLFYFIHFTYCFSIYIYFMSFFVPCSFVHNRFLFVFINLYSAWVSCVCCASMCTSPDVVIGTVNTNILC